MEKENTENLLEDLINDPTEYNIDRYLTRNFGDEERDGRITSFVEIRDYEGDEEMYKALTSMFLRVCINLHHRNDITDRGWIYHEDGAVSWKFTYNGNYFCFVSAPNRFEVFKSVNGGRTYRRVIYAAHSHCTNARDIATVLDGNEVAYGDQNAPAANAQQAVAARPTNEVRDIVRQAIVNELHQEVGNAVRAEIARDVRGAMGAGFAAGIAGANRGHHAEGGAGDVRAAGIDDAFIERLVDAVIRALQAAHIIQ